MTEHDFDVAVTFAGEDRVFVDAVVNLVKDAGFSVFYDEDAKVEMWGEDLTEYFPDVYERRARFAVMFISASYAAKPWTRLERRSVLLKALQSDTAYLLPVRLDSTPLPGVRGSIAYLDGIAEGPAGVATAITGKLGGPTNGGTRRFNGRVPRTPTEAAIMLGERPGGWEYLLFSYLLATGLEQRRDAYNDHRLGFALGGGFVATEDLADYIVEEISRVTSLAETFEQLLLGPAQQTAMGAPGEAGDPELIEHLAARLLLIYDELLGWSYRNRATTTPTEQGRAVLRALADYVNQPIDAIRRVVGDLHSEMDKLTDRLAAGETIELQPVITFEIPADVMSRYETAFEEFKDAVS